LVVILVGGAEEHVVDFVYQLRSDKKLAATQLLLLAREKQLIDLVPLLRGVAGVDFSPAAGSSEFIQQRIGHLLALPYEGSGEENSPVRLQIVDSVMSRLINSRRRSEQELNRFQQLLDFTVGAVMMFDPNTLACVYHNKRAADKYDPGQSRDWSMIVLSDLLTKPASAALSSQLEQIGSDGESSFLIETLAVGQGGAVPQHARLRYLADRRFGGLFVLSADDAVPGGDIEPLNQAQHDLLTGLPNRNFLLDRIAQTISDAKSSDGSFGLMVMDLDQFRDVNDSLGYAGGDELLRQIGQTLTAAVGPAETVVRLGDDDFAVLFPLLEDRDLVRSKVDVIAQAVSNEFRVGGRKLEIGASIGIAHYPADGDNEHTLLRRAEIATFLAKRDGLGIVAFEQEQDETNHDQLILKADLRKAISEGELFLHYQPKVKIGDCRCIGVEALARWVHPQRGFIPPDEFVALAERTGLIKNLTRWVITQALEQAARWREAGNPLRIAVNLSARNLHEPDLVAFVKSKLQEFSLPPSALQFELTESDIMADPDTAIAMIDELHRFGIEFAVDDYGTGYSSLAYLKKLRISELKIDKGFIGQLNCAGDDMVIVHSTITMAHQLGIRVVAEGVEDQEIWDLLDVLECDIAQGYLISRPVSAQDLDAALEKGLISNVE